MSSPSGPIFVCAACEGGAAYFLATSVLTPSDGTLLQMIGRSSYRRDGARPERADQSGGAGVAVQPLPRSTTQPMPSSETMVAVQVPSGDA